ncbi:hypothetical protein ACNKHQ_05425 [Shigella flexneri]
MAYSRFHRYRCWPCCTESRVESLHAKREGLSERFATLSFDVQKTPAFASAFSRFIGSHLSVAFEDDPDAEMRKLNTRRNELERALSSHESDNQRQAVRTGEEGGTAA